MKGDGGVQKHVASVDPVNFKTIHRSSLTVKRPGSTWVG
jgi:hypothetical protein